MASNKKSVESTGKTIFVAAALCIVCSIFVSVAAVQLRPTQEANKALDFKRNILAAAGILKANVSVMEQFEQVETRLVNLDSGEFSTELALDSYDQRKAEKNTDLSHSIDGDKDIAGLSRRENYSKVYLVKNNGTLDKIILPIRGYGLWSTLRGFIALKADLNTVVGLGYYEHAETPGLGGEVDNPRWKSLWQGKQVYDMQGQVQLSVVKGSVSSDMPNAQYKVDGLSGATLTSNGVDNMIKYWMGQEGFKPFLTRLKNNEA